MTSESLPSFVTRPRKPFTKECMLDISLTTSDYEPSFLSNVPPDNNKTSAPDNQPHLPPLSQSCRESCTVLSGEKNVAVAPVQIDSSGSTTLRRVPARIDAPSTRTAALFDQHSPRNLRSHEPEFRETRTRNREREQRGDAASHGRSVSSGASTLRCPEFEAGE